MAPLKSGLAIASMVIGIVSLPATFLLIGILLAPIALVLGIISIVKANRNPMTYGGKGYAIAGITVSSVAMFFIVPVIAAIAIPNLLAARRAANEGSAFNTLQKIAIAQESYSSSNDSGECGEMTDLAKKNLIPAELAAGRKNGYRFAAGGNVSEFNGCEVRATPQSRSEGTRAFYFSSMDGVIRVTSSGEEAGPDDAPVSNDSRASN